MPLNPLLNIDLDFFANKKNLGNTPEAKIKAVYFDKQFNTIGDYINDEIIPLLDQLVSNVIPGTDVLGTANKLWVNVGDGTTRWDKVRNENILENSIAWSKLANASVGAVLIANNSENFTSVAPTAPHQVLISRLGEPPAWRLINGDDFPDRSITGNYIALGSIKLENCADGLFTPPLYDNAVKAGDFAQSTVTTNKIADGALTLQNMKSDTYAMLTGVSSLGYIQIATNMLPDVFVNDVNMLAGDGYFIKNLITNNRIPDNLITNNKLNGIIITSSNQVYTKVIYSDLIADQGIGGNLLINLLGYKVTADAALGQNKIRPENLPANYRAVLGV